MDCTDASKLKKALMDAFLLDVDKAIASCPEPLEISDAHQKRMREILDSVPRTRRRKFSVRIAVAILAALLILLTSCAVWYQKIVDFVVRVFDEYIMVEQSATEESALREIKEIRMPEVMPEGYELQEKEITPLCAVSRWKNSNSDFIIFKQTCLNNGYYTADNEVGDYQQIQIGEYTVFYHCNHDVNTYVWNDGHSFSITSTQKLSEKDIFDIIYSIN